MQKPAAIDKLAAMVLESESRASKVARLLHDEAGQTLTAIGFHLSALRADAQAATEIRGYLEQVMDGVRQACNQLQSNVVERSGLPLALELLARRMEEQRALRVLLRVDGARRLDPPLGFAVYRIVELALDNVARHAGTGLAEVELAIAESSLHVTIHDRGVGFDTEAVRRQPSGTGIPLMEAYAGSRHLHLRIDSTLGRGTIIGIRTD
jgi:signal transduction histidine kinase